MKNLKRQNPGQLFVAQELINKVIKLNYSVAELRNIFFLLDSRFLSHPTRVRGLKPLYKLQPISSCQSHPTRVRGLKHNTT